MPKYSRKNIISDETKEDAQKVARGTQRPGQTKEQTKLIAQGIQKGIDLYKKQQKSKARDLDKKLRQVQSNLNQQTIEQSATTQHPQKSENNNTLPWILLIASWTGFAAYILLKNTP